MSRFADVGSRLAGLGLGPTVTATGSRPRRVLQVELETPRYGPARTGQDAAVGSAAVRGPGACSTGRAARTSPSRASAEPEPEAGPYPAAC